MIQLRSLSDDELRQLRADVGKEWYARNGVRRRCPKCGNKMYGAETKQCWSCHIESRKWTREQVIQRFQDFHRLTGRRPTQLDTWKVGCGQWHRLSEKRAAEIAANPVKLPTSIVIYRLFESWADAIDQAGLTPPLRPKKVRTVRRKRSEVYNQIIACRQSGLTSKETAIKLKISYGHVNNIISDPDGIKDKARKNSYRLPCPKCATLMTGSDGPNKPRAMCTKCWATRNVTA